MFSWPPWRYEARHYCPQCHRSVPSEARIYYYCPRCYQTGKWVRVEIGHFRWMSLATWWKPWTWGDGFWLGLDSKPYEQG